MMEIKILALLSLFLHFQFGYAQVAFAELSKIGIIEGKNYNLKLRNSATSQTMVVKMIPNLSNLSQCSQNALTEYKKLIKRMLEPIDRSIKLVSKAITTRQTGEKFWGAVIGGLALGVATSAQITAGIALHNSLQNAKAVMQLKEAIQNSNEAITHLKAAGQRTVIALSGLQDQINTMIVPSINTLGCQVAMNSLGLQLNRYFSEVSLVFGPNLREPALQTLSIQALSRAFNGDFESILSTLGYSQEDLLDVLESQSIRARITGVSMEDYFVILEIEYPTITTIEHAVVQSFNKISFNHEGSEWVPIFPTHLLIRMNLISNIDLTYCSMTQNSVICPADTSSPISKPLYQCVTGDTSKCIASRNVNSQVSRYAISKGVLFANCVPVLCQCKQTQQVIVQDRAVSNVMITADVCKEVFIDGIYIVVGPKRLNRTMYSDTYQIGGQINIDPVDIGSDLSQIQNSLNETQNAVDRSNAILNRINPNIVNGKTFTFTLIMAIIGLLWMVACTVWLIYLTRVVAEERSFTRTISGISTVNSLSSLMSRQQ
ncbi:fusion protein [Jingmen Miniopterus schreibersii paramyxovirus 2]|nr:fusion protein [Jingmen Miniopterus schreibersii paramyxovirus 2]